MRTLKLLVAACCIAILPSTAFADTYCSSPAPVVRLLTYRDGSVLILPSWRGDFMQICNLNTTWKGVSPSTCFAWMSQIASNIASGKGTGFWYESSDTNFCSAAPTYGSSPSPVYVDTVR